MYRWLLKRNITLFKYTNSVLHGKMATRDQKWVTIGSYNVNDISAYASIELNIDVNDVEFATHVQQQLEDVIKNDCTQITEEEYNKKYNIVPAAYTVLFILAGQNYILPIYLLL